MRVYCFRDLRGAGVHFTRKHIRTLERAGEFPQRFRLGVKSVAWVAEEIDTWVDVKIRARQPGAMPARKPAQTAQASL